MCAVGQLGVRQHMCARAGMGACAHALWDNQGWVSMCCSTRRGASAHALQYSQNPALADSGL